MLTLFLRRFYERITRHVLKKAWGWSEVWVRKGAACLPQVSSYLSVWLSIVRPQSQLHTKPSPSSSQRRGNVQSVMTQLHYWRCILTENINDTDRQLELHAVYCIMRRNIYYSRNFIPLCSSYWYIMTLLGTAAVYSVITRNSIHTKKCINILKFLACLMEIYKRDIIFFLYSCLDYMKKIH